MQYFYLAFLYAVLLSLRASVLNQFQHQCLNVGNAFRSMQFGFQTSLSSKRLQIHTAQLPSLIWATLSSPCSSASNSNPQIQFGQSQIDLQTQFHSASCLHFQLALKISESFRSGTSLLKSSQPSNSTTLSAELSNWRSILQFLR